MLKVLEKYQGRKLEYGKYDCNLLILEATGFDITNVPEYSSVAEGRNALGKYTGCKSPSDYLVKQGYKKINPALVRDFDIINQNHHCGIFFDGKLFAVDIESKTFKYHQITTGQLKEFEVYSKWHH
ncbi:hypothetical protein V4F87_003256 [Vibrio parahaemolyticus]|nr:hypothetical protein [Vibrio parahaemolyticus]